jgi:hypothetical protein
MKSTFKVCGGAVREGIGRARGGCEGEQIRPPSTCNSATERFTLVTFTTWSERRAMRLAVFWWYRCCVVYLTFQAGKKSSVLVADECPLGGDQFHEGVLPSDHSRLRASRW